MARMVARISAVFTPVGAVPMKGGRYVVRERSGIIGCVYHCASRMKGWSGHGRRPSVAVAVVMG